MTILNLLDTPEPLDLPDAYSERMTTFLVSGIVNPFGPTLNAIYAIGGSAAGDDARIVRIMLNPFVQSAELLGHVKLAERYDPANLSEIFARLWGPAPTLIFPGEAVADENVVDLCAAWLAQRENAELQLQRLEAFPGDPWRRVQANVQATATPIPEVAKPRGPLAALGKVFRRPAKPVDIGGRFATILLNPEHTLEEFKAFHAAWNGALENQRANGNAATADLGMTADDLAIWLGALTDRCRMPATLASLRRPQPYPGHEFHALEGASSMQRC